MSSFVNIHYLTGNSPTHLQHLISQMHYAFSMKELGSLSYFLGIAVQSCAKGLFLSQSKYAREILHKAGLADCKPCISPSVIKPTSSSVSSAPFAFLVLFRSIVGALQYLTITRPDLAFAVNQAYQHMHFPTVGDFAAVKRLLRYLKGTIDHGLIYQPSSFELHAFSDSDWGGDCSALKSSSSYCVYLGDNLISWSAKKQTTVSRSSTGAEYRSLAHTAAELSWLQCFFVTFIFRLLPLRCCSVITPLNQLVEVCSEVEVLVVDSCISSSSSSLLLYKVPAASSTSLDAASFCLEFLILYMLEFGSKDMFSVGLI
ncbi:uncharacterized mitochondrial protein AtMg00810-like [Rhododendron vialii]|uniref:uncharacterized mitochondrial protein AtMg00810-like n=1 Tax=Rhododendron vialii TaxID=182163 RepID=UPI00265E8395|nr:uncharacterized mitochondrial protein AtMg00810-like [Rhododendron vialii]